MSDLNGNEAEKNVSLLALFGPVGPWTKDTGLDG